MAQTAVVGDNIPVIKSRWRDAFHKDETLQRSRPAEHKGYLPNPHRGTTTFQRFNGDPLYPGLIWDDSRGPVEFKPFDGNLKNPSYPDTTVSYCRWLWSVIEPAKGKFRWDIIDNALKAGRERGQTVQMRIQPYIGNDLPEWYFSEAGGKADPNSDPKRREPDHNHATYLKHFGDAIRAFGKRYDGHPDLESFDIAYGGACGECGGNTTRSTAKKLVDVYLQSFRKTHLVSMLGTFGCAAAAGIECVGWRADCYGDMRFEGKGYVPDHLCWNHMFDAYPKEIHENGVSERWKTAPVTMETCWTVGFWEKMNWDVDWIFEQGLKYHTSIFMPKSSFIPDRWREKFDAWDNRLGYRFVLRQFNLPLETKAGSKIPFWMWVENIGCAPIYRPYPLALRFKQGKTEHIVKIKSDVRQWMPGDWVQNGTVDFPKELKRGEVEVDIGIIDAKTNKPRVLFAIKPSRDNGWHPLCKMDVV